LENFVKILTSGVQKAIAFLLQFKNM